MIAERIEPAIKGLIASRSFAALRDTFKDWPPADLADLIAELPESEQALLFRVLPHRVAGETFAHLQPRTQRSLLQAMGHEEIEKIINTMSPDDRTTLLEELPSEATHQLLQVLTTDERKVAQCLLGYPEKSVGRLMTPNYVAVHDDWTLEQVLDHILEHGEDKETLNVIYVVDAHGKLIDDVRIREVLLKPRTTKVSEIRDDTFVALRVGDPEKTAVAFFKKYDRNTLPVIDSGGALVGIVTIDDVLDVAEKEATSDMQKVGGLEALDEPYTTISLPRMVKK
jgi:magnesium transporter